MPKLRLILLVLLIPLAALATGPTGERRGADGNPVQVERTVC